MLLAVARHRNIQSDLIPRIATGFCGGIAYTGGMCGAVSGGIMSLGLAFGRINPTDNREQCYQAIHDLKHRFVERFKSLTCPELTGVNLGTPEGHSAYWDKNQIEECKHYVAEAVNIVLDLTEPVQGRK